ncbi:MAG: hypothetical protein UMU75_09040 [Halomonas sp.]|nr:hypothetical protein [Halomonas sp.]
MTVSIWHLLDVFTSEDVSLMLAGADPEDFETRNNYPDDHFKKQGEFHQLMVGAAQDGKLQPYGVEVADRDGKGEVKRELTTGIFGWHLLSEDDDSWKDYPVNHVRFYVHRREVYRWLTEEGINESKIPEALRIQPGIKPDNKEDVPLLSVEPEDINKRKYSTKASLQSDAIIEKLHEMGYEPTEIPKAETGKRGVRADVKDELLSKCRDLFTEKTFKTSWQQLRNEGLIRDKEP